MLGAQSMQRIGEQHGIERSVKFVVRDGRDRPV
jgi:hypothetical protein